MVRARPLNAKEKREKAKSILQLSKEENFIEVFDKKKKVFSFDRVFDEKDSQMFVYEQSAFGIVENLVKGYNGTVFAYGQTGCGKTYSMMGVV